MGLAIYDRGRLTLEDVDITRNEATYSGGGLYCWACKGFSPPGVVVGTVNIKNSRIVGNKAAHQGGGLINFDAGTVTIDSSRIEANRAAYGGGVLNHLGTLNLNKVNIVNNRAMGPSRTEPKGEGGGVWTFGPSYKQAGCIIKDNLPDQEYIKPYPPTTPLANNLSNESAYTLDLGDARLPKSPDGKSSNAVRAGKGERFELSTLGLLPWTKENMKQRYQKKCGNCWIWAGTTCLEVNLAKHLKQLPGKKTPVRLSIQYLNSNFYRDPKNKICWACCGGNPQLFAEFYSGNQSVNGYPQVLAWNEASNAYSPYYDGDSCCMSSNCPAEGTCPCSAGVLDWCKDGTTRIAPGFIGTNEVYKLKQLTACEIPIEAAMNKEEAINIIKKKLKVDNEAIYLSMYLSDTQWEDFSKYWWLGPEEAIWRDVAMPPDRNVPNGHAATCIGYDDTDPNNRYWIVLNSGGRGNYLPRVPLPEESYTRPNGIFLLSMDLDYTARNYLWWTFDPVWDIR